MRGAVVGGLGSALEGKRCPCCSNLTASGQSVLYQRLDPRGYQENKLVFHADCLRQAVERAPDGLPARGLKAEVAAVKQRARRLVAAS